MLIIAATPIGNLADTSDRLRAALEESQVIAAEDTRRTRKLIAGLGIETRAELLSLHEHNEHERAREVVARARNADVLLVSDAGMPGVSDPGYRVVNVAIEEGIDVTVLPGPSAVLTALVLSGLPSDR